MKARRSAQLKQRDQRFGRLAESAAAWALRLKGFRILSMRWSCRFGEIDLIARRGALIIFVEVKARQDAETALSAITRSKRDKLNRSIRQWLTQNDDVGRFSYRIDAVLVLPWRWPKHVENIASIEI
jgi:putative endonuclease